MGILNATPDSFSDGGKHHAPEAALARARKLFADGADIIDIGGESTRPGFTPVAAEDEARRVLPVIAAVRREWPDCPISVDTVKAEVAEAALAAGADIINDVSGAADPRILEAARKYGAGLVLMHGWAEHLRLESGAPPECRDVGDWTLDGLRRLLADALAAGVPPECIALDPGFGFGKKGAQNADLLAALPALAAEFAQPLLIGVSRKHFLAHEACRARISPWLAPEETDAGDAAPGGGAALRDRLSAAFALAARAGGGSVFRVHDAAAHVEAFAAR